MSPADEPASELEERAAALLAASVTRLSGHVRSRLNQARQAAVAEADLTRRRPRFLHRLLLVPTAGAAAATLLVAVMLWQHRAEAPNSLAEGGAVAAEDLDLVVDGEGLDLVEEADGAFYEWAAGQSEPNGESSG